METLAPADARIGLTNLAIEDVLDQGAQGQAVRDMVRKGMAVHAIHPSLGMKLADLSFDRGQTRMALEFMAMGLAEETAESEECLSLLPRLIEAAAWQEDQDRGSGVAKGVEDLFVALDRLDSSAHSTMVKCLFHAFCEKVEMGTVFLRCFGEAPGLGKSECFTLIAVAVRLFEGDLEGAWEARLRLMRVPSMRARTLRTLVQLCLTKGEYAQAEELCRRSIADGFPHRLILCDLAMALFAQGRQREGRDALAQSIPALMNDAWRHRRREIGAWREQLEDAMKNGTVDNGEYGIIGSAIRYTRSDLVDSLYQSHRDECVEPNAFRTISGFTNHEMFGRIEGLLTADPDITKVINYGTLCGVREYEIAARYPLVTWAGFDISELATKWNRACYERDNVIFDCDLDRLLGRLSSRPGKTLLVHCRTADVMLPEAVKAVYRTCHAHGVEQILSAEYFSRCIDTLRFPDFEAAPVDTVHWDGILMVHNYEKILPETGYRIAEDAYRPVPILISASGEGQSDAQMIRFVLADRVA